MGFTEDFLQGWSRRRFLAVSGGAAAQAAVGLKGLQGLAQAPAAGVATAGPIPARSLPPEVISGGTVPLMEGHTARPLRYKPVDGEFVIRNGREFFNRPIYGVSTATQVGDFRVDAGDLPEFSLYLPGHGGNLKLGFIAADGKGSKWAADADEVIAKYRPGRMIYEIRDALLGSGMLRAELLTSGVGQGLMLKVEGQGLPAGVRLAWAFGGVSGKKGRRGGDIGCEVEPVSKFFQVRAEECEGNEFRVLPTTAMHPVHVVSKAAVLEITSDRISHVSVVDFDWWTKPPAVITGAAQGLHRPILIGWEEMNNHPTFLMINRLPDSMRDQDSSRNPEAPFVLVDYAPSAFFAKRSAEVEAIAGGIKVQTPDEYVNAGGAALCIAAETIWDQKQQCVMHGGVAWRQALAGWRGPYILDTLGWHERTRQQIRHWLAKQNVKPIDTAGQVDGVATGAADANVHLTRHEGLLHSNGDLGNNHYDMNMVFFDVLLRHLMWTGDTAMAREVWPALQRHLAWERRLFRRTYKSASGKELPLYEAYAAIWVSDNLQYNGAGTAHSSAYNYFALKTAARVAKMIGEDGSAYAAEADAIHAGMNELLWVKDRGLMAEAKDLMEPQTVYTNPALWTVYHSVDSEVPDPQQAWQMVAERLATIRQVPIHGEGVPDESLYMLACSDWLPYMWSLNLLLMGENMHMALAMWQVGMRDEAFRLYKGTLLDSMYMGLCAGDFHMTSALDAHRQEAQRDFGDPMGCSARALVEGLFGVQPDLVAGEIRVRPGFPSAWERASLKHPDFDLAWKREKTAKGVHEEYELNARFAKTPRLVLRIPARTMVLPLVTNHGTRVRCMFEADAVGEPMVRIELPAEREFSVKVEWSGAVPGTAPAMQTLAVGDALVLPRGAAVGQVEDPQGCLKSGRVAAAGFHTIFVRMQHSDCRWLMPVSFMAKSHEVEFAAVPAMLPSVMGEQIDLSSVLKHRVTEIFAREYTEPRSKFCSLAVPDNLLGGWANPDGRATIDDAGLRAAGGLLKTAVGVDFRTPAGDAPNCVFLSHWQQDASAMKVGLNGRASGIYLLMAGSTTPQCSRMVHATISVTYADGSAAKLPLRNPENWWPIEQDYLLDDYFFVSEAPLPPRVNLKTGQTRLLDAASFKGKGRTVPGGAATIVHLPLDAKKEVATLGVECELYGVVVGLLAATLVRA